MNETIDSNLITGINNPAIAEKAQLPAPIQLEAQRVAAVMHQNKAWEQVGRDEREGEIPVPPESKTNKLLSILEKKNSDLYDITALNEEFRQRAEQHRLTAEAADISETETQQAVLLLDPEDKDMIIAERQNEAKRIQKIGIGVAISKKLQEKGIDPIDWIANYMLENPTSDDNKAVAAEIEKTVAAYEAGEFKLEADDYKKAAIIYDRWVDRLASDTEAILNEDPKRHFGGRKYEKSSEPIGDPAKLVTEGVNGGGWYSQ